MTATTDEPRIIDGATGETLPALPLAPAAPFQILDVYAEQGVRAAEGRPDWIATISAGTKAKSDRGFEYPVSSKNGEIYIHDPEGRAAGLALALNATNGKSPDHASITITFPYDDLGGFIHQHFTRRSATALEIYGDQLRLTEIVNRQVPDLDAGGKQKVDPKGEPKFLTESDHVTYTAGSPEYRELLKRCKCEVSVLFALARWIPAPDGPRAQVEFPDGFAWYRLRFTSRHSLNSIVGKLNEVSEKITGGRIAGLPFLLSIAYRDVPGPDGKTRKIPVWILEFKPPETIKLTSGNMQALLRRGISEGEKLRLLPRPREQSIADAMADEPDIDLDISVSGDESVAILTNPDAPAEPRSHEATYFAMVKDTVFATDEGRAAFLTSYTDGATDSLATFLDAATETEALALVAVAAGLAAAKRAQAERAEGDALAARIRAAHPTGSIIAFPDDLPPPREPEADDDTNTIEGEFSEAVPETEPPADPPTAKERDFYRQLLSAAGKLGLDLMPFEINLATVDRSELLDRGKQLRAAVTAAQTKQEQPR